MSNNPARDKLTVLKTWGSTLLGINAPKTKKGTLKHRILSMCAAETVSLLLAFLLVYTLLFFIAVTVIGNVKCNRVLDELVIGEAEEGIYIADDISLQPVEGGEWEDSHFPQKIGSARYIVRTSDGYTAAYCLRDFFTAYTVFFVLMLLLIPACGSVWRSSSRDITKDVLKPLEELNAQAKKLEDKSDRLPADYADDTLRELAQSINALMERIDRDSENERTFISNISHEEKTPLAVIMNYAGLLRDFDDLSDEYRKEAAGKIIDEVGSLRKMIDVLKPYAGANAGLDAIRFAEYNLSEGVERLIGEYRALSRSDRPECAKYRKKTFAAGKIDEDVYARCDYDLIKECMRNLIDNAVKYTGDDGVITVGCENTKDACCLWVQDNGTGMNEEEVRNIGVRFYRAPDARGNVEGHGLGLSIVKFYVDAHKGRLEVASRPGAGSRFSIFLNK